MVPFYGQGLNCGLEDVKVLASMVLSSGLDPTIPADTPALGTDAALQSILEAYSRIRHADLVAICDLAMHN